MVRVVRPGAAPLVRAMRTSKHGSQHGVSRSSAARLASRVLDSVAMIGISTSPQPEELEIEHDAGVMGNKYQDATAPLALQVVLCQHRVRLLSMADPNKWAAGPDGRRRRFKKT